MKTSFSPFVLLPISCLLVAISVARADLNIYTDSLASGWYDANTTTDSYVNTSPVHSGSYSISINTPNPDTVWYIYSINGIDTSGYAALNFWVYAQANQLPLAVYANNSYSSGPLVLLNSIVPGTWQQQAIPLSALGVANQPDFDGIILLSNVDVPGGGTLYLDDISLVSVPEPGAVMFGVLGMAAVCFRWRNRI